MPGLLLTVVLSGCATGFDRSALSERLQMDKMEVLDKEAESADNNDTAPKPQKGRTEPSDGEIERARTANSQLTFPCRIAVYLKPAKDSNWRWTPQDKEVLNSWATVLRQQGIASHVFPMAGMFVNDCDLKHLRMAAARYGADALLVVAGAAQTDNYINPAAMLNLTIVGGYIVPGSHSDALFIMQGGLMDVRNGCLYASVEAEGEGSIIRPTFLIEDKDAVAKAKRKALEAFGPEMLRHLKNLRDSFPPVSSMPSAQASVGSLNPRD
jgi:hypothetical protein